MTYEPPVPPPANFGSPQRPGKNNTLAVTSFALGLAGIVVSWFLMGIPSTLAIIFGHVSLRQMRTSGEAGRGLALTGLIMGYTIIAMYLVISLFFLVVFSAVDSTKTIFNA
ncbi:MAG: hypothetical protein RIS43_439 [Actinomycetota bacterium]|jgi:peptidyl-prolyl cis-trans isomerase B (cyclophilin B)